MKIINKTKSTVAFAAIKRGDVFACGEDLYMKTETEHIGGDYETCGRQINAVHLLYGRFAHFKNDQRVTLVDAQLVLGGN